jgi:hypothetical protein
LLLVIYNQNLYCISLKQTLENPENIQNTICTKMISKLHFEVQDLKSYFDRHKAQASKAHIHMVYQLIWFTASGTHYVDYEEINYPKKQRYLLVLTKFILLCPHTNNEGVLIHFNDFSSINLTGISTTIFTFCFNEIGQPRLKTLRSIASTAFYNLFKKNEHRDFAKEQLFFLAKQSFTQY